MPDPAYKFGTPPSTARRLNGWFRGTRVNREVWDRAYSRLPSEPPVIRPSPFARWVRRQEGGIPRAVVDVGCGTGTDDLWFARKGASVLGLDYALRGSTPVAELAASEGADLTFRAVNLNELRSTLTESARVARQPGPRVVTARHIADATDRVGRAHLWRACDMMLRGGGRLYVEWLTHRGSHDPYAREQHLRPVPIARVVAELESRGATVLARRQTRVLANSRAGHRIGRLVVEWRR